MTPWFQDGLRFECTRCGHCCTGSGYVWITDVDVQNIAGFLGESTEVVAKVYTRTLSSGETVLRDRANSDCIFYERSQGCLIYPVRPIQCQTWPFWARNIDSPETWAATQAKCPGSGQGDLISVEEILTRVRKTPI